METLKQFNNVFTGTELMKTLNMYPSEIEMPENLAKIDQIAKFLNSQSDPQFFIDRAKFNKTSMKNIDFLYTYSLLNLEKQDLIKKVENLDRKIKEYE